MEHIMLVAILHANVGTEVSIFHFYFIFFLIFICIDLAPLDPDPLRMKLISMSFYSVADPGCLSRIPVPGSWFLPIPDPGSKNSNKRQGWKKIFVKPFFVATNFTKLNIILFLICWRKKFGPIFQELLKFLPKKLSPSLQKYGFGIRDPGSGINLFRIPDPGVKKAPDPGSGSATLSFYLHWFGSPWSGAVNNEIDRDWNETLLSTRPDPQLFKTVFVSWLGYV